MGIRVRTMNMAQGKGKCKDWEPDIGIRTRRNKEE